MTGPAAHLDKRIDQNDSSHREESVKRRFAKLDALPSLLCGDFTDVSFRTASERWTDIRSVVIWIGELLVTGGTGSDDVPFGSSLRMAGNFLRRGVEPSVDDTHLERERSQVVP